jgi:hypothetical protein
MNDTLRQVFLVSALSHLAKAVKSLEDAEALELRDRAFELANDVLKTTQKRAAPFTARV